MFDLDGTLCPSINFPKNFALVGNFVKLQVGKLGMKPEAPNALRNLRYMGKRIALISNMSEKLLAKYLASPAINAAAPIDKSFDTIKITGRGKVKKSTLIRETLDEWNMRNTNAVYYGDTLGDAIACHDAHVRFCLVGTPKAKDLCEIKKISSLHIQSFGELGL